MEANRDVLATASLVERLNLLGLSCDEVPFDHLTSAVVALACFPMAMVANVHAWTSEKQFHVPVFDLPGLEEVAEAMEMGRQEARLPGEITPAHLRVLRLMSREAKAPDRVIYEYALESLARYLDGATAEVAESLRSFLARSIVGVAEAAGKSLFSARKVSPEEMACIQRIAVQLRLDESPSAVEALRSLSP